MNGPSYLLTIDGSAESRSAAYFAWELARQTEARVAAQHVVDTRAIWQFLSYDLPGFIGSGVYLDAKERITEVMKSVAESLMLAYTSQVSELSDNHETYIDEG
ncbi:MAG TPA: universal stress protein, partial [Candidatus Obscuribacter sp.]|nr:universal stress protein [Candidatus Obscuribacter sp.]